MKFLGRLLDRLSWPVLIVAGLAMIAIAVGVVLSSVREAETPAHDAAEVAARIERQTHPQVIVIKETAGTPEPPAAPAASSAGLTGAKSGGKSADKSGATAQTGKAAAQRDKAAADKLAAAAASDASAAEVVKQARIKIDTPVPVVPGQPETLEARIRKRVHDELARVQGELERAQAEALREHGEKRREAEDALNSVQQEYAEKQRASGIEMQEASREYSARQRQSAQEYSQRQREISAEYAAAQTSIAADMAEAQGSADKMREIERRQRDANTEAENKRRDALRDFENQRRESQKELQNKQRNAQREMRDAQREAQRAVDEQRKEIEKQVAIMGDRGTYKIPKINIPEIKIPEFKIPEGPEAPVAVAVPPVPAVKAPAVAAAKPQAAAPAVITPPVAPVAVSVPVAAPAPAAPLVPAAPLSRDAMEIVERDVGSAVADTIGQEVHTAVKGYRLAVTSMLVGIALLLLSGAVIGKMVVQSNRAARTRADLMRVEAERNLMSKQVVEAQLKMMQAQIEPHFLFNTLANVRFLMEGDAPGAGTMLDHLIEYLHAALPQMRENSTTLGRESELARAYLEILKIRMGGRLAFGIDVPENLQGVSLPPMMLLSLVENAIKHGLEPMREGGRLDIVASVNGDSLRVAVKDTGMGLAETAAPQSGTGVGLANIRARLKALYGERAHLTLEENQPRGVVAAIEIPYDQANKGVAG